jgi:hypothetical protein
VPQWAAKKPSKACKWCAQRRKACTAPKEWLEHVAQLRPEKVGSRKGTYLIRPVRFGAHTSTISISVRAKQAVNAEGVWFSDVLRRATADLVYILKAGPSTGRVTRGAKNSRGTFPLPICTPPVLT